MFLRFLIHLQRKSYFEVLLGLFRDSQKLGSAKKESSDEIPGNRTAKQRYRFHNLT